MLGRFCEFPQIILTRPAFKFWLNKPRQSGGVFLCKMRIFLVAMIGLFSALSSCAPQASDRSREAVETQTPKIEQALAERPLELGAPVFIRIVKTVDGSLKDGYLELFLEGEEGVFELYKTWPICTYSGALGPKLKQGDKQSPEGFYFVRSGQMNPNSSYHLSFNLGYPNAYDRAHNRTGDFLMVHGNCVSVGCYAMTDPVIEEIYTIMSAAYEKGQPFIRVHIFPFPMTEESLDKYSENPNAEFWQNLKQGWDWFQENQKPPNVNVENKKYVFSAP